MCDNVSTPRVGLGYDAHRLVSGRPLVLGGVTIPHETGLDGHSDADVLTHAVMDALLGAAALPDIGVQFPNTDAQYAGVSSLALLRRVAALLKQAGYRVGNIDATVVAQAPRLSGYITIMRETIAQALDLPMSQVNVKATTEEHMGFTGRGEGISSTAVCLIVAV